MKAPIYNAIGQGYARFRRPDPRIAAAIGAALGDARSVINVGAGAGSYEPRDRAVLAVEPSEVMIAQRAPEAAPCVCGVAEHLPVESRAFDAAMAVLTLHHWRDWRLGLWEMHRVARARVVVLAFDVGAQFWLTREYLPEIAEMDRRAMPSLDALGAAFEGVRISPVLVPHDCRDGFLGAYWRRPEAYLDANVRGAISAFSRIDAAAGLGKLAHDLTSGAWRDRNADILAAEALDVGYRLLRWDLR